jgi:hypothetical protein
MLTVFILYSIYDRTDEYLTVAGEEEVLGENRFSDLTMN